MQYTAEEIRNARVDHFDMTQSEFADYLGVSLRTLAAWEAGETKPGTRAGQRALERAMLRVPRLAQFQAPLVERRRLQYSIDHNDLTDEEVAAYESQIEEIDDELSGYERERSDVIGNQA